MEWRKVPSYPELEASSDGQIRLAEKSGTYPTGYIYSQKIKMGYQTMRFYRDGKRLHLRVSRLVCEAFHGKPLEDKPFACHKNGNSTDNNSQNLYWASHQENMADREKHGNTMRGDKHYFRQLSSSDIPEIRKLLKEGIPQTEIAKKFSVTNYAINDIKRGKSWKMCA